MGNLSASLLPDFLGGGGVVGQLIILVTELVGVKIFIRVFCQQLPHPADGTVSTFVGRGQRDLGTEGLDHLAAFDGNRLAHDDLHIIALDGPDHGQSDACVTRGGLNDGLILGQSAGRFGLFDHFKGDAVLNTAGGVKTFYLGDDFHPGVWA